MVLSLPLLQNTESLGPPSIGQFPFCTGIKTCTQKKMARLLLGQLLNDQNKVFWECSCLVFLSICDKLSNQYNGL